MSTYVVNFTDSTKTPISIPEENIDVSTDITLFGRKRLAYGADMNENMLSLLEKFACPENSNQPGTPDTTKSGGKLVNPIRGQMWYNSTQKVPFVYTGTKWVSLLSQGSIASNWGIIFNGQQLPQPVGDDGYVFNYNECVWIVGPFVMDGTNDGGFFDFTIDTDTNGVVTANYNSGQPMVVNYMIVGIKGNTNSGNNTPVLTPTPTPTISLTPSVTPLPVNLNVGLVSFWEFEEGGTEQFFLDCVGTNNFQRFGADCISLPAPPPRDNAHGVVGKAIQAGNTTFFESNPVLGMSVGANASYSFGGWFKINPAFASYSNLVQRGIFGQPGQRSFCLTYNLGTDNLVLYKSADGSAFEFVTTNSNLGLDDLQWHFIVAWVDGTNLTLNIQIDNGTIYSAPFIFPATFDIGTLKLGNSTGIPLQTAVDQLFYYNRVLNSSERGALWNSGNGVTCALASGLITPTPSPTRSPTPTPPVTPTLTALSVSLSTAIVNGSCNGANCSATTNPVFGSVTGGVYPYTYEWVYVAGAMATANTPTAAQTTFSRQGTSQTLTGYYRLKVTDTANVSVYSAIVEVTTTHS